MVSGCAKRSRARPRGRFRREVGAVLLGSCHGAPGHQGARPGTPPPACPAPSADRAAGRHRGVGAAAGPRVGAGRLRQDHAAVPVARRGGRARHSRRVALAGRRRQRPAPVPGPPRRGGARRRARRSAPTPARCSRSEVRAPGRGGPGQPRQRPRSVAGPRCWRWTTTTSSTTGGARSGRAAARHLPPQVTLAITTRVDPPLAASRLRARGELVELRAADLRFTPGEAEAFLNDVMGLTSARAGGRARIRTEGWAAGLQLAALSHARPRTRTSAVRRRVHGQPPLRPGLPRRGGARWSAGGRACVPAGNRGARPADGAAVRRAHRARGRQRGCSTGSTAATSSWCRSTTSGGGTATTTCSPTPFAPGSPPRTATARPGCTAARGALVRRPRPRGRRLPPSRHRRGRRAGGRPGRAALPGLRRLPPGPAAVRVAARAPVDVVARGRSWPRASPDQAD